MRARSFSARLVRTSTLALLAVAGLVVGCDESPVAPGGGVRDVGRVAVFANTTGTGVTGLVIEVNGPGIVKADGTTPDTLFFNLDLVDGVASGSLDIPVGVDREFVVRAFTEATETHRGGLTTDIASGTNPTVTITLFPLTGSVPIELTIGTTLVFVAPDSVFVNLGDTLRMTATVKDQNGATVTPQVVWGTTNSSRATVDPTGLITVRDTGLVMIVATQGGVAGTARIYGKRFPVTTTSYQLTWDGSKNRNWSDTANWTAQDGVDPRVPTAADSVVIPAGIPNQPLIDVCAVASVRDLVMEPSATLGSNCSPSTVSLRVYRSANDVTIGLAVEPQGGASVSGSFTRIRILEDGVTLGGDVTATELQLAMNGRLTLAGNAVHVSGAMTVSDTAGLIMSDAADTLSVRGIVTIAHTAKNTLSAGAARFGSTFHGSATGWAPTGSFEMYFDGTNGQMALFAGTGKAVWPRVRVANPVSVHFQGQNHDTLELPQFRIDSAKAGVITSTGTGTERVRIIPEGGTLVLGLGGLQASATATIIDGSITLPAKPSGATATPTINGGTLVVNGGTLTIGDSAVVNPSNLHVRGGTVAGQIAAGTTTFFDGAQQPIAPEVASFAGHVVLRDSSRVIVGNGVGVIAGDFEVADSAAIELTDAADTLSIRGRLTLSHNGRSTLSAGVVRVGGGFNGSANAWVPTGTFEMIFDGVSSQFVRFAGTGKAVWPRVRIANQTSVHFQGSTMDTLELPEFRIDSAKAGVITSAATGTERVRIIPEGGTLVLGLGGLQASATTTIIDGSITLPAKPAGATETPTISGGTVVVNNGIVTVGAGATVNPSHLMVDSGSVAGSVNAGTTTFRNTHQSIAPDVAKFHGHVVLADTSRLIVGNGTSIIGGDLSLEEWSGIEMTDAADTLSIRGRLALSHNGRSTLSAGVVRVGGGFNGSANAWMPTGTFEMIFDGVSSQFVRFAGTGKAVWPRVRIANQTSVHFQGSTMDTLELPEFRIDSAKAEVITSAATGTERVRIIPEGGTLVLGLGGLQASATTTIIDGNVSLPAKPSGVTSAPTMSGKSWITGNLTTGVGSVLTGDIRLFGAMNFGGTFNTLHLELAGEEQIVQPSISYGSLSILGHARFMAGDTVVFSGSGRIEQFGVMDVDTTAYVQFGRTSGVSFTMVNGAQLNNKGIVRYTASHGWTTPTGAAVVGNMPASTAPAHIQVVIHPEATGTADSAVATMPKVRVIDALSFPLKGVTVTFTPIVGGSQLTGVSVVTDTNGYAQLGTWKLGPTEILNVIEATVSGATSARMQVQAYYSRRLQVANSAACATANSGSVYCWGDARTWQYGAAASSFGSGSDTAFKTPVLTSLTAFARSSTGFADHLCGIDALNSATCWGKGGSGQLGTGSDGAATGEAPATVAGGIEWKEVSRGPNATCGVSTSGTAYCWGRNSGGVLGINSTDTTLVVNTPTQVSGAVSFKAIAVGTSHACGISTAGATYCWGSNAFGQVGNNSASTVYVPTSISGPSGWTSPGAALQVAAGSYHSCIATASYKIFCWGQNDQGQVGNNSQVTAFYPRDVTPGGLLMTQVTAGNKFTCALQDDGKPYCWGLNNVGQLGDGTFLMRTLPTVVGGSSKFNAIAAGESHVCGNRGGTTFCWGSNALGQVGNNSTLNANFPMRVGSPF